MSVSFDDVSLAYQPDDSDEGIDGRDPVLALSNVTHTFAPGTATLVTGRSGCGKSTLLRLVNGLIPHITPGRLSGRVTVAGHDVASEELVNIGRFTASIFQNPRNQFFAATVREELAFARQQAGEPREEILKAVDDAAARLGMEEWLDRGLRTMSGGELQRVACATAVASPARIILFDEPTSNLSSTAISEIADIMAGMKKKGYTLIIAEHRLHFLRDIVDAVATMDSGRIDRVWSPSEFFGQSEEARTRRGLRTLTAPRLTAPVTPTTGPGPQPTGLTVHNLRFSYGSRRILDLPHLAFPAGSVTAIVGPNGVGKTTLCRVLTGLARPERGSIIEWDGEPLSDRRRRGFSSVVMQDVHRQLFAASVADEVVTGSKHRVGTDVEALLEGMDLGDVVERHPMSLSGGQKQRLVVATVLADDSRIVVFDEPTSGVDHQHLVDIAARVRGVAARGAAVLVVSHDVEFINACADRVVDLASPGDGEARGGPSVLRRAPSERIVH